MKRNFILATILAIGSLAVKAEDSPVLVTPQWVKENMNDSRLVILQVNFLRLDFEKEHIDGARLLWPDWLTFSSPEGSYNPPDPKEATKILQEKLGINKDSKIVLTYLRTDLNITARMFVTLEYLGLKGRVSLLNGGLEAWKNAGNIVVSGPELFKKGNYNVTINPVLVDKDYVVSSLNSNSALVIDARLKRFYDGDPTGYPRDGHIKGALNIQYTDMFDSTSTFKPDESLLSYFKPVAPDKQKEIVDYCFIGQTASVVYLAARQLGYKIKLYDGSMQEWSRLEHLPMEKTKKD